MLRPTESPPGGDLFAEFPLLTDPNERQWHRFTISGDLDLELEFVIAQVAAAGNAKTRSLAELAEFFRELFAHFLRVIRELLAKIERCLRRHAGNELLRVP